MYSGIYVCTYEDCAEGEQQYDNLEDWVRHEISAHRDTQMERNSLSEQISEDRWHSRFIGLATLNEVSCQECPVCLEKSPTFVHIGRHL